MRLLIITGSSELSVRLMQLLASIPEEELLLLEAQAEMYDEKKILDAITACNKREPTDMRALAEMLKSVHIDRPRRFDKKAPTRADYLQRQILHRRRTGRK